MGEIGPDLKRILRRAGFVLLTVDTGVKSRHTANAILKKAGLPKAF